MNCYLINLDHATDRLKSASKSLSQAGFDVIRVPAIDGYKLVFPCSYFSERIYKKYHGKTTNPPEVGCYLSHLKAIGEFLKTDEKHALVVEDDIVVSEYSRECIEKALEYNRHWDLLRLSALYEGIFFKVKKLTKYHNLVIHMTRLTGAGAYVINRKAARIFVNNLREMKVPFDHAFDREWFNGYKVLSISPPPFDQVNLNFSSQIDHKDSHKLPKYLRYWTVFPYRAVNEISRVFYRTARYILLRMTVQCE